MRAHPPFRAAWPSADDNTGFNLIVVLLGCVLVAWLLWSSCHGEISAAILALRHYEIAFIRLFSDRYDLADQQMLAADPDRVTLADLCGISHAVGMFFRVPAAGLMLLLAAVGAAWTAPARYKRAFDLDGLIREQATSSPTSAAFVHRHLRLVPAAGACPRIGSAAGSQAGQRPDPWARAGSVPGEPRPADYALSPDEWITRFATGHDGSFDEAAARRALVRQLGSHRRGLKHASPQVRCLFAAFALHLAERRSEALRLLGDLSAAVDNRDQDKPEGPDAPLGLAVSVVAEADAILRDGALINPALSAANRHA